MFPFSLLPAATMQLRSGRIATPRSTPQPASAVSSTNPFTLHNEDVVSQNNETASTLTDPLDRESVTIPDTAHDSANRENDNVIDTGDVSTSGVADTSANATAISASEPLENETEMTNVPPPLGPPLAPFVPVIGEPRFPHS